MVVSGGGSICSSPGSSFLQVPKIVNLQPESRYELQLESALYSPLIRVTPPSLHSSMSMSNVSTVVAQIETNIPPADTPEASKSNISLNTVVKDNLDVRIDTSEPAEQQP